MAEAGSIKWHHGWGVAGVSENGPLNPEQGQGHGELTEDQGYRKLSMVGSGLPEGRL
jgi:hypothetical protein